MLPTEKFKPALSIGASKHMPVVLLDDADTPIELEAVNVTGTMIV